MTEVQATWVSGKSTDPPNLIKLPVQTQDEVLIQVSRAAMPVASALVTLDFLDPNTLPNLPKPYAFVSPCIYKVTFGTAAAPLGAPLGNFVRHTPMGKAVANLALFATSGKKMRGSPDPWWPLSSAANVVGPGFVGGYLDQQTLAKEVAEQMPPGAYLPTKDSTLSANVGYIALGVSL